MRKQIELLENHSHLLAVNVNVDGSVSDVDAFEEDK